jgi:RNA-directed DNA polymerase
MRPGNAGGGKDPDFWCALAPICPNTSIRSRTGCGGRRTTCGTSQGGFFSPTLANVYMNRFLKYWRRSERSSAYRAHIVSYADDFVILSRGHAEEALAWTEQAMARLGLTLNEAKTSIRDARRERFDFLGYAFGPHHYRKDGHWYLGASPSKKSVRRLKQKVGEILVPGNQAPWPEVRDRDGGPYTPQSIANAEYPHIPPGVVLPLRVPGNAHWNAVARSSRHILSA